MKRSFIVVLFILIGQLSFSQITGFTKDFYVSATTTLELTNEASESLDVNNIYKVHLVTRGTGTNSGAEYLVWYNPDIALWNIRETNLSGTTSNHPKLIVGNNVVKVATSHANNYYVRALVEEFQCSESDVNPNIFGSSYQWQRKVNNLYYTDGNVGIGTTTIPSGYKLAVNGKIIATEIQVETGWADFVFEPTYNLMPLNELNTYIQENKHLPEIPTTAEVQENGISVGEMNAKLLQKIEELTLYVIELKEENEAQNNTNSELLRRVEQLENK
jgi:hypothetical protein